MKPAFKFFLAALVVGVLFGLYYAFGPKKTETETVKTETVDSIKNVNTVVQATPTVATETISSQVIVSQTEATPVTTQTVSNTVKVRETSASTKPAKAKEVKEAKPKKQKEERENLNVNFN